MTTMPAPLWLQNLDYNAQVMRALVSGIWPTGGVITGLDVTAGPAMSVNVAPGIAVIHGADMPTQGNYLAPSDVIVNAIIGTAPQSGNIRIDTIVAEIIDDAVVGSGTPGLSIHAVPGSESPSPSPPTLPATCEPLADVRVPSGTAAISASLITNRRKMLQQLKTVPPAAPPDPRDTMHAKVGMTNSGYHYPGAGVVIYDTFWDPPGLWVPARQGFVAQKAGLYDVDCIVCYASYPEANGYMRIQWRINGGFPTTESTCIDVSGGGISTYSRDIVRCAVGDVMQVYAGCFIGDTANQRSWPAINGWWSNNATCDYIGTG